MQMGQRSYSVSGMTCQHCVSSVAEEIAAIDGVTAVDVDLPTGSVTVNSDQPVDESAVHVAIRDARFELANAS